MVGRLRREVPLELSRLAGRFAEWRRGRPRGARIPASLWRAAVTLAGRHGVSWTAAVLRVSYYALQRRVEERGSAPRRSAEPAHRPPLQSPFVELAPASLTAVTLGGSLPFAGSGESVVEFTNPAGWKMRFELKGREVADLVALGRSFWDAP